MDQLFKGIYKGKRVLLTGHTGFKGSWLFLWLKQLGANVKGYSLAPLTSPSHIQLLELFDNAAVGDIRNIDCLKKAFIEFKPQIVFHLAAQPLVKKSYIDPLETFQTNVMGTANVLECIRHTPSVKALVNITTDKVYRNHEWNWPYRETDSLGGHDPYSTSKACVELVHESYVKSYLHAAHVLSATARAGNVIGGGDWAEDRLIPDVVKASVAGRAVEIRNPNSVRPWQHVLDPLSAYLLLGQLLLEGNHNAEGSWNFGPDVNDCVPVQFVLKEFHQQWEKFDWKDVSSNNHPHESKLLRLDCSKALHELQWKPVWDIKKAIGKTAGWYKNYYTKHSLNSLEDLINYCGDAIDKKLSWSN